jgi:hypothetical protein
MFATFCRALAGSESTRLSRTSQVSKQLQRCHTFLTSKDTVAPGGWLQVQEIDVSPRQPQQCTSWNDFICVFAGMFDKIGIGANFASKLGDSFEKARLRNMTIQRIQLPAGKKLGNNEDAKNSLIPFKITIPTLREAVKGRCLEFHVIPWPS